MGFYIGVVVLVMMCVVSMFAAVVALEQAEHYSGGKEDKHSLIPTSKHVGLSDNPK